MMTRQTTAVEVGLNVVPTPPVTPKPLSPMLVSGEVAVALNYLRAKDGKPDRRKVRKLAREGKIPGPVDDTLHALDWRWSRRDVEAYANHEWQAS